MIEYVSIIYFLALITPSILVDLDLSKYKTTVDIFDGFNVTDSKTKVSSQGPDITRSKYYVYLIGASYCGDKELAAWTCKYCKMATGQAFSSVINNATTNTQALVTINSAKKEIVVSFRGSNNVANLVQDVTIVQVSDGDANKNVKVHKGFLDATVSLYPRVVQTLADLLKANPGYKVVIAGHSLGASMASLTLYMLINKIQVPSTFPAPASYALFTYGQPRTGNKPFANFWNSQSIQVSRVVNNADVIPHSVSAEFAYLHHSTELWINAKGDTACSKTVYEDPKCSNSQGPVFSVPDHLKYWDVDVLNCAQENAVPLLTQIAVPISR